MKTNTNQINIWIYVTDIKTPIQNRIVKNTLNMEPSIIDWNIDNEDVDNVLRVETFSLEEHYIQDILEIQGLKCKPMMD